MERGAENSVGEVGTHKSVDRKLVSLIAAEVDRRSGAALNKCNAGERNDVSVPVIHGSKLHDRHRTAYTPGSSRIGNETNKRMSATGKQKSEQQQCRLLRRGGNSHEPFPSRIYGLSVGLPWLPAICQN